MALTIENISRNRLRNPFLWSIFLAYLALTFFALCHHEMWGDEIHSWNIAKASGSISALISHRRYEGHPPVWYIILWTISKFTHNLFYVQLAHFIIISLAIFLFLFYSSFALPAKLLTPFGYYFIFEYAVISRNYAIAVLVAFAICVLLTSKYKHWQLVYYLLLLLLVNTHLFALLLAASIHLYFLLRKGEENAKRKTIAVHVLAGLVVVLVGLYFIRPPSDSASAYHFWIDRISLSQTAVDTHAALSAFVPLPAWWEYHSWNTEFILALHGAVPMLKFVSPLLSLLLIFLGAAVLRKSKKSLILFLTNFLSTSIIGLIFPLSSERYVGFIFISFVVALWLADHRLFTIRRNQWIIYCLLSLHVVAGIYSVVKDIRFPFSNFYRVKELSDQKPTGKTVADYLAVNAVVAFTDKPFYCLDLKRPATFLLWDQEFYHSYSNPHRYTDGVRDLFAKDSINHTYMVSNLAPPALAKTDDQLFNLYHVRLISKIEGAIVKTDNLYLYEIAAKTP